MHSKVRVAPLLFLSGSILLGCGSFAEIPADAIDALLGRWRSLPGSETHDLTIVRAWPGHPPSEPSFQLPPSMQVWCVETELSPGSGASPAPESMIWLVTKADEEAAWESMPLMALSSTWPYEACLDNGAQGDADSPDSYGA